MGHAHYPDGRLVTPDSLLSLEADLMLQSRLEPENPEWGAAVQRVRELRLGLFEDFGEVGDLFEERARRLRERLARAEQIQLSNRAPSFDGASALVTGGGCAVNSGGGGSGR